MAVGKAEFEGIESYSSDSILPLGKSIVQQYPTDDEIELITIEKTRPRNPPFQARLPGQGEQGEDCGKPTAHHCNSCGQAFWALSTCRQRECPDCYELWASIEASKASKRLWIARREAYRHGLPCRILHCVVSLKLEGRTYDELRADARMIARRKGLSGELAIFHPFRQDDDKEWWMDGTIHFHLAGIAYGNVHPAVEGEGFVWKVIKDARNNDYRGFRKLRHLKACIQYQLTHCGLVKGKHTATWGGCLSTRTFKQSIVDAVPDPPPQGRKCTHCGSRDTEPCEAFVSGQSEVTGGWWGHTELIHAYPTEPPPRQRKVIITWRASPY